MSGTGTSPADGDDRLAQSPTPPSAEPPPPHPLRVLYVIEGLGTGGAERSLAEMLPRLIALGIEPEVACFFRREEGVEAEVVASGIPVHLISAGGRAGRLRSLRRLVSALRPDVVHTTLFEADVLGRLACAGLEVPVLSSLVNTSYLPGRLHDPDVRRWRLEAARIVDGLTARHLPTHFHALTNAVKDASVRALGIPPRRITVIPRGRDPARLGCPDPDRRRRARVALGIQQDTPVLVNVGRQEFQKGHHVLLRAAARLSTRRPVAVLVAGRTGKATTGLRALQRDLGLAGTVRFLGHRDDVPEVLAAADVFVFPSLYEGLGGAVLEAMALGIPVVASDLPVLREVVQPGRTGLLVPPGDPVALAQAVDGLLDRPARAAALGQRARKVFQTHFTLDPVVSRMAELYRRCAH